MKKVQRILPERNVTDKNLEGVRSTLRGLPMECAAAEGDRWSCAARTQRPDPPTDRSAPIVITADDSFGNVKRTSTSIVLDFVEPEVAQASRIYVADGSNPLNQVTKVDTTADVLNVQQDQVSYIRSPIGNADPEDLEDASGSVAYTIPAGVAFYELGPPDGLDPVDALDADTFEFSGGVQPTLLRAWADDQKQNLLGTTVPDSQGDWPRSDLQLVNLDTPQVYVTGIDEAGNESDPVLVENGWFVGSTEQPALGASPHRTAFSNKALAPLKSRSAPSFTSRAESPDAQAEIARAKRAWLERSGQSPPARPDHALAYDSEESSWRLYDFWTNGLTVRMENRPKSRSAVQSSCTPWDSQIAATRPS